MQRVESGATQATPSAAGSTDGATLSGYETRIVRVLGMPAGADRQVAFAELANGIDLIDMRSVADFVSVSLRAGGEWNAEATALFTAWGERAPDSAAGWVIGQQEPLDASILAPLARILAARSREELVPLLTSVAVASSEDVLAACVVNVMYDESPEAAMEWVMSVQLPDRYRDLLLGAMWAKLSKGGDGQ